MSRAVDDRANHVHLAVIAESPPVVEGVLLGRYAYITHKSTTRSVALRRITIGDRRSA